MTRGYDFNTKVDDLSVQQNDYVTVMSRYHQGTGFTAMAFYDIADTTLKNGEEDVWANEVGLENNLTGKLNYKALNDVDYRQEDSTSEQAKPSDLYNNEEGNIDALNTALLKGIAAKYPEVSIVRSNEPNTSFQTNLNRLADYLLETKSKLVKKENRALGIQIIVGFVYCFTKLKPQTVLSDFKNHLLTRESYLELKDRINEIITLINRFMLKNESRQNISESIPQLETVDQMLDMMGISNEEIDKNSVKENFKNMLNRMNECKFYNDKID